MHIDDLVAIIDWIRALIIRPDDLPYDYVFRYQNWKIIVSYFSGFEYKIFKDGWVDHEYRFCELYGYNKIALHAGKQTFFIIEYGKPDQHYSYHANGSRIEPSEETFCRLIPDEFMKISEKVMLSNVVQICRH